MEPLWSPVVATGGNRSQIGCAQRGRKQAKPVAVGCHRLRFGAHGKEGVDGSSPSEGSAKEPHVGALPIRLTCSFSHVRWVWSRLWSFQVQNAPGPTLDDCSGSRDGAIVHGSPSIRLLRRDEERRDRVG